MESMKEKGDYVTCKKYIDLRNNTYSLIEFQNKFGSEQACKQALYAIRAGETFCFDKNGLHSVKAEGKFKMALLIVLK